MSKADDLELERIGRIVQRITVEDANRSPLHRELAEIVHELEGIRVRGVRPEELERAAWLIGRAQEIGVLVYGPLDS